MLLFGKSLFFFVLWDCMPITNHTPMRTHSDLCDFCLALMLLFYFIFIISHWFLTHFSILNELPSLCIRYWFKNLSNPILLSNSLRNFSSICFQAWFSPWHFYADFCHSLCVTSNFINITNFSNCISYNNPSRWTWDYSRIGFMSIFLDTRLKSVLYMETNSWGPHFSSESYEQKQKFIINSLWASYEHMNISIDN